jgi:hypothetical protein
MQIRSFSETATAHAPSHTYIACKDIRPKSSHTFVKYSYSSIFIKIIHMKKNLIPCQKVITCRITFQTHKNSFVLSKLKVLTELDRLYMKYVLHVVLVDKLCDIVFVCKAHHYNYILTRGL